MHPVRDRFALLGASLLLGACVSVPTGPSVMVLPGSRTSFEQFQIDDSMCRSFALQSAGIATEQVAAESGVATAAVTTAVGAAAGAAIGAAAGAPATGAAIGAGSGLLLGSATGVARADASAYAVQQRYDYAYMQCMYAKGNQIPVARSALERSSPPPASAPRDAAPPPRSAPPRGLPPAPPLGPPPPPPPDA
jgi:hypothetical protein